MIKLLGLDLDGTLFRNDKSISERSLRALDAWRKDGREYIIVTGRNKGLVQPTVDEYHLRCDMILNSGHQYIDAKGNTLFFQAMDFQTFEEITTLLLEHNFHLSVHTLYGKYIFVDKDTFFKRHMNLLENVAHRDITKNSKNPLYNPTFMLANTTEISDVTYLREHQIPILKMDARNEDKEACAYVLEKLHSYPDLEIHSSFGAFIEITENTMNKGLMLKKVLEHKHYSEDEVAVFGDSSNDVDMLATFTHSYAMANGSSLAKEKASMIIDTNENDGVAKIIEELLKDSN
ncbi:MAG: Cof-type HAD-IIB family hydrolase [Erysipelotrichaceae bacterium]|nr:Cof-type HAD-IIB family hydrolase [Erysipelotrichaceae bacterium]